MTLSDRLQLAELYLRGVQNFAITPEMRQKAKDNADACRDAANCGDTLAAMADEFRIYATAEVAQVEKERWLRWADAIDAVTGAAAVHT